VADEPRLIIQVPRGGAVERQLNASPPPILSSGEVVVIAGATDDHGQLEAPTAGEVVLSLPSPEALVREAEEIRVVLARAGKGVEPLVVVLEAAEELREDELAAIVEAAGHSSRAVILRVVRDG
jgi:hypothetical protein